MNLSPTHQKRFLALGACVELLLAVTLLWIAFHWPLDLPAAATNDVPAANSTAETHDDTIAPNTDDFEEIVAMKLQRPLFDPPPAPEPPPTPKPRPTPPSIQVLATMIEPGGSQTMVEDANGNVVFGRVGDQLSGGQGDAKVVEITATHVLVTYSGTPFELPLQK